ncbi:MAG: flagellin [Spirochaetales bacterium]|nr:flagellin [Spirochaetales bacterium]
MGINGSLFLLMLSLFFIVGPLMEAGADSNSLLYLNNILKGTENSMDKNFKWLSGGVRLLADDPANYAIYERLEAHIRALTKQVENVTQLIAYYDYVEAMLGYMNGVLQRIRELIIMKSNSIYSDSDRSLIDSEIDQCYEEILFVLENAEFNRKPVFKDLCEDDCLSARFKQEVYYQLENVDSILSFIITQRTFYGSKINQLEKRREAEMIEKENAEDFQSTILDVDYGSEITLLRQNQLLFLINILLLK